MCILGVGGGDRLECVWCWRVSWGLRGARAFSLSFVLELLVGIYCMVVRVNCTMAALGGYTPYLVFRERS